MTTSSTRTIALRSPEKLRGPLPSLPQQDRRSRSFSRLLVLPLIVMMLFAIGYPIVSSLWMSLTNYTLTGRGVDFLGLQNYTDAIANPQFQGAMTTTSIYVVVAVTIELALGMLIAVALHSQKWARNALRSVLIAPMFIAPIAVGLTFRFLLNSQIGVITEALASIGISIDFFGPGIAVWTLIIMDVWQWTPFMVLLLASGLVSLPTAPNEAAKIDGAGPVKRFFWVTVPMLKGVIGIAVLLRALDALRVFEYVFATTKGGPGTETVTIQYLIYQTGVQFFRLGSASAMAFILLAAVLLIIALATIVRRKPRARI